MEWRRSPAGLQRTSLSTPFFYEKFNDVLRHQVQKIICTDFDRKKRKAVVFGFFGVGNGNVKYFFDCSFFLFSLLKGNENHGLRRENQPPFLWRQLLIPR